MYRKQNLRNLQDIFDRSSNDIAVLYGSRATGLSEIVSDLIRDKECLYYRASEVSEMTQRELFANELHEQTKSPLLPNEDYEKLISSFINSASGKKKLIVFDDFQHLIRENPTFINFLASFLFEKCESGTVMYLLVSDDVSWVEKDMIRLIGRKSSEISTVIKLNEYSPSEFSEAFPKMPLSEVIGIYSFIGGKSGYYNDINDETTLRDLIIRELSKCSDIHFDPNMYLPKDIREPQMYNTIIMYLAKGVGKLNDVHNATGCDRAKLSVYIKSLIEADIVEKRGTAFYVIRDRMVRFYYRFLFPHLSSLAVIGVDRFYRRYIEHDIFSFMEEAYPIFCMEQIKWLRANNRLNFRVASIDEFYDKSGAIDFIITAAGGSVIACSCRYAGPHMSYKAYEDVRASVRKNKLTCDNIWLFSASGFDQKLSMFGSVTPGVKLIDGADQRLH